MQVQSRVYGSIRTDEEREVEVLKWMSGKAFRGHTEIATILPLTT